MLDKTKFYSARYCKVYRHVEVNDGKGCNVRQRHGSLCSLLGKIVFGENKSCLAYSSRASGGFLADN